MRRHGFDQYDVDRMEEAKQLLMRIYDYHFGDSKMRNEIKRLETIIEKIQYLQDTTIQ